MELDEQESCSRKSWIHLLAMQMLFVLLMTFKHLIAGFDEWGKDHDEMLENVFQICRQVNLKLNKEKNVYLGIPIFPSLVGYCTVKCKPGSKNNSSSY